MRPYICRAMWATCSGVGACTCSTVMRDRSGAGMLSMLLPVAIQFTWLASMAKSRIEVDEVARAARFQQGYRAPRAGRTDVAGQSCRAHQHDHRIGQRLVRQQLKHHARLGWTRTIPTQPAASWTGCWPCRSHGRKAQPCSQPAGNLCLANAGRVTSRMGDHARPSPIACRAKWSCSTSANSAKLEVALEVFDQLCPVIGQLTQLAAFTVASSGCVRRCTARRLAFSSGLARWRSTKLRRPAASETRFGVSPEVPAGRADGAAAGGFLSGSDCTSACTASSMDGSGGSPRTDFSGLVAAGSRPCRYRQFVIAQEEVFGEEPDGGLVLLAAYSWPAFASPPITGAEQTGQCCWAACRSGLGSDPTKPCRLLMLAPPVPPAG